MPFFLSRTYGWRRGGALRPPLPPEVAGRIEENIGTLLYLSR
jgi:hypothetical protein